MTRSQDSRLRRRAKSVRHRQRQARRDELRPEPGWDEDLSFVLEPTPVSWAALDLYEGELRDFARRFRQEPGVELLSLLEEQLATWFPSRNPELDGAEIRAEAAALVERLQSLR